MQKLVFKNAKDVEIDLTTGDYGITEWSGFSNVDLNIQSQQVPFQDGGVFLDGLLGQRELSVTLAINDEKDLEKRYRLRRELISAMNPKLGEGLLIYTNDYISKQIHVIPQIPIFENHNSNDSGTPKANLTWTACNPYWEDVEETTVYLKAFEETMINYTGDIPSPITIESNTWNSNGFGIKDSMNNEKRIVLKNIENYDKIFIDTSFGKKQVLAEELKYYARAMSIGWLESVAISEDKNIVIVIGGFGEIFRCQYKEDLENADWTSYRIGLNTSLREVLYIKEKGIFVAVGGGGTILTSPDGINWTSQTSGVSSGELFAITYSSKLNLIIVAGVNGTILTSPDGINWTSQTSGTNTSFYKITSNDNIIVAIGDAGIIYTSEDGITWISRTSGINVSLLGITFSKKHSLFVAVGGGGTILTSPDGINWTSQTSGVSEFLKDIIFIEGLGIFVVVGDNSTVLTSVNGINWILKTVNDRSDFEGICYDSNNGTILVVTSEDGILIIPSRIDYQLLEGNSINLLNVIYYGFVSRGVVFAEDLGCFVAVKANYSYISLDCKEWKTINNGSNQSLDSIAYREESDNLTRLFVAVGNNGKIITSDYGFDWSSQDSGTTQNLNGVAYSNFLNLFVAVGNSGTIITSPDGVTWTPRESGIDSHLNCIYYSEDVNKFVVGGQYGRILTSSNGFVWTQKTISQSYSIRDVTYSRDFDLYVAIGTSAKIFTSPDCNTWTQRIIGIEDSGVMLNKVCYSKKQQIFLAVGNKDIIVTSPDGINWHIENYDEEGGGMGYVGLAYSNKLDMFLLMGDILTYTKIEKSINIINKLEENTNLDFMIEPGLQLFQVFNTNRELWTTLKYRQKYIGV